MKYNTMRIEKLGKYDSRRVQDDQSFTAYMTIDKQEREEVETQPNAWGFFHFLSTMSPEKAFDKLRSKMVTDRLECIKSLKQEIIELEKLQWKKK